MKRRELSSTEKNVLTLLQRTPTREFILEEIVRETKLIPGEVYKAIAQLEQKGYITERRAQNARLLRLSPYAPLYRQKSGEKPPEGPDKPLSGGIKGYLQRVKTPVMNGLSQLKKW